MVTDMAEQYMAARLPPINRITIQIFGRKTRSTLLDAAKTDEARKRYLDFVASDQWAKNFMARRFLQNTRLHGEAGSVDHAAIAKGMAEIREVLEKYDPNDIYNKGETVLCYRLLPKQTYLAPGKDRKTARGVKGMTAKDRITVYFCTNATGTRKMPLTIIGTAANPRCFRTRSPPVKYLSQKRAWSDRRTIGEWWQAFLTFVRTTTTKPVLLLVESHSIHADLVDPRNQVAVKEYPPRCARRHQPMDQGVIASWKRQYKTELLKVRVDTIESAPKLREQARARGMGVATMGLAEGHQAHVLDAAEIACQAWEKISQSFIVRYAVKGVLNVVGHGRVLFDLIRPTGALLTIYVYILTDAWIV